MNKFNCINAVTLSHLPAQDKLLLIELVMRADDQGQSWPSVQRLCMARGIRHEKNFKGADFYLPGLVSKVKRGRKNFYTIDAAGIEGLSKAEVILKHTPPLEGSKAPSEEGNTPDLEDNTPDFEGANSSSNSSSNSSEDSSDEIGEVIRGDGSEQKPSSGSVVELPRPDSSIPLEESDASISKGVTPLFAVQKSAAETDTPAASDAVVEYHPTWARSAAFMGIERFCKMNYWANGKATELWARFKAGDHPELAGDEWIEQVLRESGVDVDAHLVDW